MHRITGRSILAMSLLSIRYLVACRVESDSTPASFFQLWAEDAWLCHFGLCLFRGRVLNSIVALLLFVWVVAHLLLLTALSSARKRNNKRRTVSFANTGLSRYFAKMVLGSAFALYLGSEQQLLRKGHKCEISRQHHQKHNGFLHVEA